MNQTRQSQRSIKRSINYVDVDENVDDVGIEYLSKDAAQFILANEHNKTITRNVDLKKSLGIATEAVWKRVYFKLKAEFKSVFGLILVSSEAKTFLVSALEERLTPKSAVILLEEKDEEKRSFLTLLLTTIFMLENNVRKGSPVKEEQLLEELESLNLVKDVDDALGNISKLIGRPSGEFIRQGWITCKKIKDEDCEKEEYVYEWGLRARASINAMKLLEWHCKIEGTDPTDWPQHYRAAEQYVQEMKRFQKE